MPAHDTDSQFKFLIACIKHSANGKIDFTSVANDLDIVSKAAAAKRYERLMKAHDIPSPSKLSRAVNRTVGPSSPATPTKRVVKKRKAADSEDEDGESDTKPRVKANNSRNSSKGGKGDAIKEEVKEEPKSDIKLEPENETKFKNERKPKKEPSSSDEDYSLSDK